MVEGEGTSGGDKGPRRRRGRSGGDRHRGFGGGSKSNGSNGAEGRDDPKGSEDDADAGSGERFDPDGEGRLDAGEDRDSRDTARRRDRRRRRTPGGGDVEELGASSGIDVVDLSSDRRPRRVGGLEPGLTLRDLLPFLRPPKTVLILGATTGGGHNRTASSLVDAFKGIDRNLVVRQHDVLELVARQHDPAAVRALLEEVTRDPALFGSGFGDAEEAPASGPVGKLESLLPGLFAKKMEQVVVDKRPDHIVCTHWLPLEYLSKLKTDGKLNATVTAVIPDPDVHTRWVSPVVSHYLLTEDALKGRLQMAGIDPSLVTVTGPPVPPVFAEALDRDPVLRDLGFRNGAPVVMLNAEGLGDVAAVTALVTHLLEVAHPVNLMVATQENAELREALGAVEAPAGSRLQILGSVPNMHELMGISDLLITRALSYTLAQASAVGLPVILLAPDTGMESRAADHLLLAGCARKAYGLRDLDFLIRELVKNRRYLKELQDAAHKRRRADAAHLAVERIAKIVR